MISRTRWSVAGAVAIGLWCGSSLAPVVAGVQDVTLSYKWAKGDTLRYRIVQQSTTNISGIPGMGEMTIDQSTSQIFKASTEDVAADGTARVRQTIEAMKMEMTSPMFSMAYDSANAAAADPMLKGLLSPMLGESFTIVFAPTGDVQKVEGLSAVADKMFRAMPQDPAMAGMLDGLKNNVSDDAMRAMLKQTFAQFPSRPVKVGDSWNTNVTTGNPMLGDLVTSIVSTLKSVAGEGADRIATVTTTLTIKQDPAKPAAANPTGLTLQMGNASGDGEQAFEPATGRMRRSTTRLTMPMDMSGTGPDGSQLNLKTTIKTTTTVELVEK